MSIQEFPWNCMEIGLLMFSMEFHGKCPNPPCKYFPWKSMEKFPWNSMEIDVLILHGIPWRIFHGIPEIPWFFTRGPNASVTWDIRESHCSKSSNIPKRPLTYFNALVWRKYRYRLERTKAPNLAQMLFRVSKTNLEGVPNDPIIRQGKHFIFSTFCKLEIDIYLLFID